MIKSLFILHIFIAVVCARSFNQDDAVKEFEWSAEEEAEWKKNTQCCESVLGPMNRDKKLIKKLFDVTPEAAYAMPDDFTVKECPKKCTNFKKFRLDIASEFYGLVLYQLAGECPSLEDKYRDEDKWKMTLSEALFQMENYCYEKYSDKYAPIARVVGDRFKEVNKKVADLLKSADKEELKKFCKGFIIKGPSMNEEDKKKHAIEMTARSAAFEEECGIPGGFSGKED